MMRVCLPFWLLYLTPLLLLSSTIDSLLSLPLITEINDALMVGIR